MCYFIFIFMILEGKKCPDFIAKDENDNNISLESLSGKNFVLYFYPKDDTPGCTIEANDFNRLKSNFETLNCVIIGVSKDSAKSHIKFKEKHSLNFSLITDESKDLCNIFGTLKEKSMFGKKYIGVSRDTFLINKDGIVIKVWNNVSAKGHADDVLKTVKSL